jgi:CRISPR/Cas system Type II protein with McrA/HNH and RuvC-like nuclease domain
MTSNQFWEMEFGTRDTANDFAGRVIHKSEYGRKNEFGWTVDHILPLSLNGPDRIDNWQIAHYKTNEEKSNKNTFEANGKYFQVKKIKNIFDDDKMANYPYKKRKKIYCIIMEQ